MQSLPTLLLIVIVSSLAAEHPTRHRLSETGLQRAQTDNLKARCPLPRVSFIDMQRNESQLAWRSSARASLGNADAMIYNYLQNNDTGFSQQASSKRSTVLLYLLVIIIGIAVTLVVAPFLVCAVCSPIKCPPCQSLRIDPGNSRTPKLMAAGVVLLSLAVIGCMMAVLIKNPTLQEGYSQSRCSVAMFFDDLLYGNYTYDKSGYFMGLKPFKGQLESAGQELSSKIGFFGALIDLDTKMKSKIADLAAKIDKIEAIDKSTDTKMTEAQDKYLSPYLLLVYVLSGLILLISLFTIIAVAVLFFLGRLHLSKLMYPSCICTGLMTIVAFLLAVLVSALVAGSHFGCEYIEGGLATKQAFVHNFKPFFDNNQLVTEMVAECVAKDAKGNIFQSVLSELEAGLAHQSASPENFHQLQAVHSRADTHSSLSESLQKFMDSNCRVIGEDVALITNTFCTRTFNYAYSLRIAFLIAGFCLLVATVLTSCLAARVRLQGGIETTGDIPSQKIYT